MLADSIFSGGRKLAAPVTRKWLRALATEVDSPPGISLQEMGPEESHDSPDSSLQETGIENSDSKRSPWGAFTGIKGVDEEYRAIKRQSEPSSHLNDQGTNDCVKDK